MTFQKKRIMIIQNMMIIMAITTAILVRDTINQNHNNKPATIKTMIT